MWTHLSHSLGSHFAAFLCIVCSLVSPNLWHLQFHFHLSVLFHNHMLLNACLIHSCYSSVQNSVCDCVIYFKQATLLDGSVFEITALGDTAFIKLQKSAICFWFVSFFFCGCLWFLWLFFSSAAVAFYVEVSSTLEELPSIFICITQRGSADV